MAREELFLPLNLLNSDLINPSYDGLNIEIIAEDEFILALEKPPGIHCHALHYHETNTVTNFLRSEKRFNTLALDTDRPERGLLYRLDKETSGVLLAKKKPLPAFTLLEKEYRALVEGGLEGEFILENYLEYYGPKKSLGRISKENTTFPAKLKIKVLERREDTTLLEIKLFEGHRHQIRIQLAGMGHPVVGDPIYGTARERLFLAANRYCLQFEGDTFRREYVGKSLPQKLQASAHSSVRSLSSDVRSPLDD